MRTAAIQATRTFMGSTWSGPREAPCFDVVATPLDNGKTRAEKIQILSPGVSNET